MEQEDKESQEAVPEAVEDALEAQPTQVEATSPMATRPPWSPREPTVLTLQDVLDLPRQVLPEETYAHLRNAGREAALAVYSLWRSIDKSRKGGGSKIRTHIDVE